MFFEQLPKRKYEFKKGHFLSFISLNDKNQEFGCGRGVIDVLTQNLPEGCE